MIRFVYITLFSLYVSSLQAQQTGEDVLSWSAGRKLTWKDYKAAPNPCSDAAATTTTYLSIDYTFSSGGGFSYTIKSFFSRDKSWGRHKSDYILSHEQGHFDIAEIFARKLHQQISGYRFNSRSYQKDLDRIYTQVTREKAALQQQYDRETNHSIHEGKQAEWLKKISRMLEETNQWADYR